MRRLAQVLLILAFGLAVSGCDKCGSWYFGPTEKTCHDTSNAQ
jgi:predicted small lipoprotein YifL